jgi:hypothetical protein
MNKKQEQDSSRQELRLKTQKIDSPTTRTISAKIEALPPITRPYYPFDAEESEISKADAEDEVTA